MMNTMTTRPTRGTLLHEQAAFGIRELIYAGDLKAGERINEATIAQSLSLSRGPVREALRVLELEGIVVSEPQRGVRVAAFTDEDVAVSLALREQIEVMSIPTICDRVTDEDVEALRDLIEHMRFAEQRGNHLELMEADYYFHVRFLEIGAVPTALRVWRTLSGQIRLYLSRGNVIFRRMGSVADSHLPILKALEAKNRAELEQAVRAHIDENRASLN